MTQQSQSNGKTDAVSSLPRRATNVVLAATLAASMVPSAAFAAFEDEVNQSVEANAQDGQQNQDAVDQADDLYTQSLESEGAALAADNGTSEAVTDAYGEAVADGDAASLGLDHANLPDGQYTVKLMMMNINGRQVSMSNGAVGNVVDGTTGQHSMTLDVVNGEYWLTMHWVPLERNLGSTPFVGYLANLAYFEDYSFDPYLKGTKVDAKVLSQYVNEDGTPVYDAYNDPSSDSFVGNNIYPKDVQIKVSGKSLEDGMQPVHVFVPVMDAIMSGAGDQNAYVKLFWNSLSVNYLTTDKSELGKSLDAANALEQGKKSDDAWNALKSAIFTAQGVYDNAAATQDSVNNAVTTLDAAVKKFQDSADTSGATDPFDGVLEQGQRYQTAQMLYSADGSAFKAPDGEVNVLDGFWSIFEYSGSDEGKYAVTIADPYNTANIAASPVADSVEYLASDGSTKQALKACDRQLGAENSRQADWIVYTDDLNSKIQLNISYTIDGQKKTQTVYLQPVKEGAALVTSMFSALQGEGYMKSTGTNYAPLYSAIQDAKAVEQGTKTDDAWSALQSAISAAQGVLDTSSTKQDGITSAVSDLNDAVKAFNESADKVAQNNIFNFAEGTWYWSYPYPFVTGGDAAGIYSNKSMHKVKYQNGQFDLELFLNIGAKVESVKASNVDDISTAVEGFGSAAYNMYYRVKANELTKVYLWLTYTDEKTGQRVVDKRVVMDFTSLAASNWSVCEFVSPNDKGYLYKAIADANAIAYADKGEQAWIDLRASIDTANKFYKSVTKNTAQADIDAATEVLEAAIAAYQAAPSTGKKTYGLETGKRYAYSSAYNYLFDANGNEVKTNDKSNPFFIYQTSYAVNSDGGYDITVQSFDNVGINKNDTDANLVTAIKWNTVDDAATAKDAVKEGGYVGVIGSEDDPAMTPGYAEWLMTGVSNPEQLYYWVDYTDVQGVEHKNVKFSARLGQIDSAVDHGFKEDTSESVDTTSLFKAIRQADAITKDANKTDVAWLTLSLCRETQKLYYVNTAASDSQATVDEHTKALEDAIAAYQSDASNVADYSGLNASVASAQQAVDAGAGDKQDKAFSLLSAQLESAKKIAEDNNYAQAQVDEAKAALDEVLSAYKDSATKTSLTALSDAIATATELKAGGCVNGLTPISDLGKAITAAQGVYDKATGFADDQIVGTDAEVKDATTALNEAIEAFKEACKVDKSVLESAVTQAKAIEQGKKSNEAFQTLQQAIAAADKVANNGEASQDDVDAAVETLKSAVDAFNASADVVDGLDFDNLEDGVYTVNVDMYKAYDRESKSMSDQAINHEVELTVKNGEYFLTFDFQGLKYLGKFGYLGWMKYYDQGYTYNQYGSLKGDLVDATVLSTQKNADGTDVYDEFNTDGSEFKQFTGLYPDKVQIKYVQSARDDAEGFIPLQVFVPVMESILAGNGTQDVLAKVDKASLKKKEAAAVDTAELSAGIASAENALATSKKSDDINAKLRKAVSAAQAVLSKEGATQDEVDAARDALQTAIAEFNAAPDAVVVDKSALTDAIAKAKAVKQGNKTDSAWEALQAAIAKAEGVANNADATQADVNTAATTLNGAVDTFNASADKPADTKLDFANLPAGTYSINIDMYKMNRTDKSMSDAAINHKAKLTVDANGDYWLTFDFASVKSGTTNGYLGSLSYYDEGYTYSGAKVNGTLVAGNVVDYQTGVDGKQYPNHVTVKFVKTARNDADHFIPLQVFVPVMEEIAADCGTQDVLAKYDPSSVQKLEGEIPDQTEPGVNGSGSDNSGSNTNGTTVGAPTAKSAAATAAKTAAAGSSSLAKTGDDAGNGLLATAFAGVTAAAVAAYAAMRRRFGKQEGEE